MPWWYPGSVSDDPRFDLVLQAGVSARAKEAMQDLVRSGSELDLIGINVISFAAKYGIPQHEAIAGFLHASRVGLFDVHWNVTCPGCGGVLDAGTDLTSFQKDSYPCSLCASSYEPTLDELVEVVFSLSPSVRKLALHDAESLGYLEYCRAHYFSSGMQLPTGSAWTELMAKVLLEDEVVGPGERVTLSLKLPNEFLIVFEPITHTTHFLDVKGEPTSERQELTVTLAQMFGGHTTSVLRPGPLRLTLDNRTGRRLLPGVFRANDDLHHMMGQRRPFLTAKHVLSSQTFRDLYKTSALTLDQRLKIASLTVLFTDLRSSTELYERIGDLAAYDLVRHHFKALSEVVRNNEGSVVKTIGDAVMATFPTPRNGLSAALDMHQAMDELNRSHSRDDLVLKIGLHEGPCLAVTLNERLDYFGTTVNVAARVQALANPWSVYVTESVMNNPGAKGLLDSVQLSAAPHRASLRGIKDEVTVYEIRPPG